MFYFYIYDTFESTGKKKRNANQNIKFERSSAQSIR